MHEDEIKALQDTERWMDGWPHFGDLADMLRKRQKEDSVMYAGDEDEWPEN